MKAAFLVFAVLGCVSAQNTYQCAQGVVWTDPLGCIQPQVNNVTSTTYQIRPCTDPTNSYCPITNVASAVVDCTPPPTPTSPQGGSLLPGQTCTDPTQCISNQCTLGYCAGLQNGKACTFNSDCNSGLYCNTASICAPLLGSGQQCQEDNECQFNLGCSGQPDGNCTQYYSLAVGANAPDCQIVSGSVFIPGNTTGILYSNLCSSGTCEPSGSSYVCALPLASTKAIPVMCTVDTNCTTSNSPGVLKGNTKCIGGQNSQGTRYCSLELADQPYVNLINWTVNFLKRAQGAGKCHTSLRTNIQACAMLTGGTYLLNDYLNTSSSAVSYPQAVNSDICTLEVFQNAWFTALESNKVCLSQFVCAPDNTLNANQCINPIAQNSTISIRACSSTSTNSYCPATYIYNGEVDCEAPPTPPSPIALYPGDPCTSPQQLCNCINGVCGPKNTQGTCTADSDCNPGYYCDGTQCQQLIAVTKACNRTAQCVMTSACNQGFCTPYYSVASQNIVTDCGLTTFLPNVTTSPQIIMGNTFQTSYSALCKTGTCVLTNSTTNTGTCTSPYSQTTPLPVTCTHSNSDCPVSNGAGGALSNTGCYCGMNPIGTSYCNLALGDQPFQDLISFASAYIANFTNNANVCHTNRRGLDTVCMKNIGSFVYWPYMLKALYAFHYPMLQGALNCTLQVYQPTYWAALNYGYTNNTPNNTNSGHYGYTATLVSVLLALVY